MARKTFHQELREIEEAVIQMAALVEREMARAMQALSQRDTVLATEIVYQRRRGQRDAAQHPQPLHRRDGAPGACRARPARTHHRPARHQRTGAHGRPCGGHRQADDAHPRVRAAADPGEAESRWPSSCASRCALGIQAFVDVNVQQAREICERDDEIDAQYRTIFTELIAHDVHATPRVCSQATSLLFAAHDLERIGDRVTNICEDVIYMVTGEIEELN